MKQIFLPIEKEPFINSFLHYAFPFSILLTDSYYECWILNNFIQLIWDTDPYTVCFDYHELSYKNWPCLKIQTMYKTDIILYKFDLIDLINNNLRNNRYVTVWGDMYYIPKSSSFNKKHSYHGLLIYGVDFASNQYHVLMYTDGLHYVENIISFECVNNAFKSESFRKGEFEAFIEIMYTNIFVNVDYDFYRIQFKLCCYLNSINYDIDDNKYHRKPTISAYGINAIEKLKSFIRNSKIIENRFIYLFYEHKRCMAFRIKKILEEYYIPHYPFDDMEIITLEKKAKRVLMLALKYNQKPIANTKDKLLLLIDEVLKYENILLKPIISYQRPIETVTVEEGKPVYTPINSKIKIIKD